MSIAEQMAKELLSREPQHPLLPLPSTEAVMAAVDSPAQVQALNGLLAYRRAAIARAIHDPLRHELEPDYWRDVHAMVEARMRVIINLGGNRSGKSRMCGKMVVAALMKHPGTSILCVSEDETASIETQQAIIWHYLPPEIKAECHNRRDRFGVFYVNHTESNGFSERKVVLPLPAGYTGKPSKIIFATYNQEPEQFEGMEWGHPTEWTIAWWADENLRLAWLNMLLRRGKFRPGTGLWSYTPINGITPTIKQAVGKSARTLRWREAALLPGRVNVPGLPAGTMPYIQEPALPDSRVIYFHSEMSPFGPGPNGSGQKYADAVALDCRGKPSEYTMRIAYGYTEDVIGLCYPKFRGDVHVIPQGKLPAEGTNYCFMDPAGDRNWFVLWVRVVSGSPRRFYIYREWPDLPRYGEWAIPTSKSVSADSKKGWDGERGPAQRNQGWGIVRYKKLLLAEETVGRLETEVDPYRRALAEAALKEESDEPVREVIRVRKIDPRAAANPQASVKGGVNLLTLFADEQRDAQGAVEGERMVVLPAYAGKGIDDGIQHVQELLDWKEYEPFCPVLNEPRLYVADTCKQTIWMFENYTNQGGEDGGCKDVGDLIRYMAQDDDLKHINGTGRLVTGGFKDGY